MRRFFSSPVTPIVSLPFPIPAWSMLIMALVKLIGTTGALNARAEIRQAPVPLR